MTQINNYSSLHETYELYFTHSLIAYSWTDILLMAWFVYSLSDWLLIAWLLTLGLIVYSWSDCLLIVWLFTHCLIVYSWNDCLLMLWLFTHGLIVYSWPNCFSATVSRTSMYIWKETTRKTEDHCYGKEGFPLVAGH